jgi:membrane-associated protein
VSLEGFLQELQSLPIWVTYLALFAAALIEYVLPPVPGDTIVVAGAVLVGGFGWSLAGVYGVVTLGALVGAALDYELGRWLVRSGRYERIKPSRRAVVDDLVQRLGRHGAVYLVLNRFLPGIRAFFFVAAGLAGIRLPAVLLWAGLSAMAWNALLVAAGYALGDNLEALETWFQRYTAVAWTVVGLILAWVVWQVLRRQRR